MSDSIMEPPFCETDDHGMMVPCEFQFCYVPNGDGIVTALVLWDKIDGQMVAEIYAPLSAQLDGLPALDSLALGEDIYRLEQEGKLFGKGALYRNAQCVRIDDRRPGKGHTYLIQLDAPKSGPRLLHNTVYNFWEEAATPPLQNFDAVRALMNDPNRLDIHDNSHLDRDGDMGEVPEMQGRVVVWHMQSLARKGQ